MGAGNLVPIRNSRTAVIQPVDLGQNGVGYVTSELQKGGPFAVRMAISVADMAKFFAPLEDGTTSESAQKFDSGANQPTDAIRHWLADYASSHWNSQCRFVFEDAWANPDDFRLHQPEQPYFLIDETPYYIPQGADAFARIIAGERETGSWRYSIFVIDPLVVLPASGSKVAADYLEKLAVNTRAILISAYDHEGYVVAER